VVPDAYRGRDDFAAVDRVQQNAPQSLQHFAAGEYSPNLISATPISNATKTQIEP
jgi:hypothetical protein